MTGCTHGPIYSPKYKALHATYICRPCYNEGKERLMNGWRYMLHLRRKHDGIEFPNCPRCNPKETST